MKIALKVFKYFLTTVICVFLCVSAYFIFARNVLKQSMPKVFGFSTAIVKTGSMIPNINVGDLIITQEKDSYEIGDVVAFRDGNHVTTHRIVDTQNNAFTTKGDANNVNDPYPVHEDLVHGKVVMIVPGVGKILNFSHSPVGMISICTLGLLLIFIEPIVDYLTNKKGVTYDKKS